MSPLLREFILADFRHKAIQRAAGYATVAATFGLPLGVSRHATGITIKSELELEADASPYRVAWDSHLLDGIDNPVHRAAIAHGGHVGECLHAYPDVSAAEIAARARDCLGGPTQHDWSVIGATPDNFSIEPITLAVDAIRSNQRMHAWLVDQLQQRGYVTADEVAVVMADSIDELFSSTADLAPNPLHFSIHVEAA